MAGIRYGTSKYGTAYYGGDTSSEFVAPSFTATANGYGRALVQWAKPGGAWTEQRLVRSLAGLPVDERDGVLLLANDVADVRLYVQDNGLTPNRSCYYGLFVRELADGTWRRAGTTEVRPTFDYGYTDRLYDRLPQVFKVDDYARVADQLENAELSFLYRFLGVLGLQLDHARGELEGTRSFTDPRTVSSGLLPALAGQVGVEYEPDIGDAAVRRLVASAARLYGIKGTLAAARQLATVFTGWDAAVRLGTNIALDRLSAGPDGGLGRWSALQDCSLAYEALPTPAGGPADVSSQGCVVMTSASGGFTMRMGEAPAGLPGRERLQYAVPVLPGMRYVVSQYVRSANSSLQASAGITWLDAAGEPVGELTWGDSVLVHNTWTSRPNLSLLAPPTARYLEYQLRAQGSMAAGYQVRACGFMVQEDHVLKPWAPAREVLLYLQPERVNHVGNPSGYGLSAEGWSRGISFDGVDGYHLGFTSNLAIADKTVATSDALVVEVPGETAPDENLVPSYTTVQQETRPDTYGQRLAVFPSYSSVTLLDTSAPEGYFAVYDAGITEVTAGQQWTVLVDAGSAFEDYLTREVQVGFALYDGDSFIRYEWAPAAVVGGSGWTTLTAELTVSDNADFDRITFAMHTRDVLVTWRRAALIPEQRADAFQFDGSTPSSTQDFVWTGVPHRSTSQYYSRRQARISRLRDLLEDFLPHPAQYRLLFGITDVPDSPRAAAGTDLDPDDSPYVTVGSRLRTRWTVSTVAGGSLEARWAVESREVGHNLGMSWHTDALNDMVALRWTTYANVGLDLTVRFHTGFATIDRELAMRWNVREQLASTDALVVSDAGPYSETSVGTYEGASGTY